MSYPEDGELPGATATADPDPETQVAPGEPDSPPATPESQPAEDPTAEQPVTEGAEPPVEAQPPAPLPDGWQDHPDAKPIFDEHFNKGRGKREKELRKEMDRREERYSAEVTDSFQQGVSSQIVTTFKAALKQAIDSADEGDRQELLSLISGNTAYVELYNGSRATIAESQVVLKVKDVYKEAGLSDEVVGELGDLEGELAWKVRHKEVSLADGLRELIQASFKHIKALGASQEKERRDGLEREMTGASDRATKRGEQPPPAAPGGSGAAKPARSVDELGAMTAEQIAALPDEEVDRALKAG